MAAFEKRKKKHEHPSWAAAYALDPANAYLDEITGKWQLRIVSGLTVPQVSASQELIARMSSASVATVRAEYENLANDGIPEGPASLLQAMTTATVTPGKPAVLAEVSKRRQFWGHMAAVNPLNRAAPTYPCLAKAANTLLSAHATSAAAERNFSAWGRQHQPGRASLGLTRAQKLVYIQHNNKDDHPGIDFEMNLATLDDTTDA